MEKEISLHFFSIHRGRRMRRSFIEIDYTRKNKLIRRLSASNDRSILFIEWVYRIITILTTTIFGNIFRMVGVDQTVAKRNTLRSSNETQS